MFNGTLCFSQIVNELKDIVASCKVALKFPGDSVSTDTASNDRDACFLMSKSIDKILIRYNRVPSKFTEPFEESYTSSIGTYELVNSLDINSYGIQQNLSSLQMQVDKKYDASGDENSSYKEMQLFTKVNLAAQAVHAATDTLATLSRYFHHQRWIWLTSKALSDAKFIDIPSDTRDTLIQTQLIPLATALTQ